jgi:hypothetical protein
MAHFAELDPENKVLRVIVVNNNELLVDGVESEAKGIEFCQSLFGGEWKQTSYNKNIRKNYAGIGYSYDSSRDAFIPQKPFESWTLDEETCKWKPPVARPDDDSKYTWNEETLSWDEI